MGAQQLEKLDDRLAKLKGVQNLWGVERNEALSHTPLSAEQHLAHE